MDGVMGMTILLGIVALLLVGFFMAFWKRDKDRSRDVSDDSGRFQADPSRRDQPPGR
jgi:hypothetical protein